MLQHTLLKEADQLDGMYKQALNRIYNQVISPTSAPPIWYLHGNPVCHSFHHADSMLHSPDWDTGQDRSKDPATLGQVTGSDWKLTEEGKNAELPEEEPKFSTWDDVMGKKGRAASGAQASTSSSQSPPAPSRGARDPVFYRWALQIYNYFEACGFLTEKAL